MIVSDNDQCDEGRQLPAGLPAEAVLRRLLLPCGE